MALLGFDSGEATRFPHFAYYNTDSAWIQIANQPSPWQIKTDNETSGSAGVYEHITDVPDPPFGSTAFQTLTYNSGSRTAMRRTFTDTPLSESFISFWFASGFGTIDREFFTLTDASGTISVQLRLDSSGNILVFAGATPTLVGTIPAGFSGGASTWHLIQLHQKVSTNTLELKVDGSGVIDCSGTSMLPWSFIVLGNITTTWSHIYRSCFTAIQINDPTGSTNNSWPGTSKTTTALRPKADTAVQNWSPSSGPSGFAMIEETNPDLDTTYLVSHAFDDVSTFDLDTLTLPVGSAISGICLTAVAKRADAAYLIPVVSRGESTPDLSALKLPVGLDYMTPLEWFLELDPITSAPWTLANLNSTHFGFKHSN